MGDGHHRLYAISHQPSAISHAERHMRSLLERRLMTSCVLIAGVCLVTPRGGPSVEEVVVASAQAAEDTEGAMCLMPGGADQAQQAIAIPKSSNTEGGDLPPVRMVVDPYPSFNRILV